MLNNPSNLYSAGNVVLDSTPYMRIAAQQRMRKQAMDEALYKHYSELPNSINPAGTRDIDWNDPHNEVGDSITKRIADDHEYFNKNAKAIIKKGTPEAFEFEKRHQMRLKEVADSKGLGKQDIDRGTLFVNGKLQHEEEDMPIIANIQKSLFDNSALKPDGTRYSNQDLSGFASPYSSVKQQQFDKLILGSAKPERVTETNDEQLKPKYNDDTYQVTYANKFNPKVVYDAAMKAAQTASYDADKTMYFHYKHMLKDPDAIKIASDALSKISGVQIDPQQMNAQQMAAGMKAHELMNTVIPETVIDKEAIFKRREQIQKDAASLAYKRALIKLGISEAGKNARVAQLQKGGYDLSNPMDKLNNAEAIPVPQKEIDVKTMGYLKDTKPKLFVPFPSNMTQDEIKYITKDLPTSFYENKEGLYKDEDGNFYDGNDKIIDKDRGIINKVKAQGAVLDKQNKGKFKVTQEAEEKPQHEGTGGWRKRATNKNK